MNDFCCKFGLSIPVVLAPMGGGPSTPELVAAVLMQVDWALWQQLIPTLSAFSSGLDRG